jgi:AMP phosphorylase
MKFKMRVMPIEQGQNEVVLNEAQARELGLQVLDRVRVTVGKKTAIAVVDHAEESVKPGEVVLFQEVSKQLNAQKLREAEIVKEERPRSLDTVRKKLDGGILSKEEISEVIEDLMQGKLSPAELSAFVSGIYTRGMTLEETAFLTTAMISSGETINPTKTPVVSEHSIGGVAGDRVSMLIVPILASLGICVPKTASRAISSASGTADCMEVLCRVDLNSKEIKEALAKTNACLVWGGGINLAPADDKLIRIRNPLRLDPKPLLLASIMAKKKAEGAQFVLLDLPCGRGTKMEKIEEAKELAKEFEILGKHLGIQVQAVITDGSEPVTAGIGPALEAREVIEALSGKQGALLEKAVIMCGVALQMLRGISREEGMRIARQQVSSGRALEKFWEIIEAQGGKRVTELEGIEVGRFREVIKASDEGKISHVDNKAISRVCRALGAPQDKKAGMVLKASLGQKISVGSELCELFASTKAALETGKKQFREAQVFEVEKILLDVV